MSAPTQAGVVLVFKPDVTPEQAEKALEDARQALAAARSAHADALREVEKFDKLGEVDRRTAARAPSSAGAWIRSATASA